MLRYYQFNSEVSGFSYSKTPQGQVLTFLDAHIECCEGWLQPLLARIASDRSTVAVPIIDPISSVDMSYIDNKITYINGFHWSLGFYW